MSKKFSYLCYLMNPPNESGMGVYNTSALSSTKELDIHNEEQRRWINTEIQKDFDISNWKGRIILWRLDE